MVSWGFTKALESIDSTAGISLEKCGCIVNNTPNEAVVLTKCEIHGGLGKRFPRYSCLKCKVTFHTHKEYRAHRDEKHSIE